MNKADERAGNTGGSIPSSGTTADPGWGRAVRTAIPDLLIPLPQFMLWRAAKRKIDSLTAIRAFFVGAGVMQLEILLVTLFTLNAKGDPTVSFGTWTLIVCAVSLVDLGLILVFNRKPLDAADPQKLQERYQARAMIGFALGISCNLVGFVGAFLTGDWRTMLVSLPFCFLVLALAAPTQGHLARDQREISSRGSSLDLVSVLVGTPYQPARLKDN